MAAEQAERAAWRERLDCRFEALDAVFDDCIDDALRCLSPAGFDAYLDQARALGKLGRGVEPLLVFLEVWPLAAQAAGEATLPALAATIQAFQKSPNGPAIVALLQSLAAVARRLRAPGLMAQYFAIARALMERTSVSIHGRHATEPSPGLPVFLAQAPTLVAMLPLDGLQRWVQEGIRLHGSHPQRQIDFFALAGADSRAMLQRERRGTLLVDAERRLELGLRGLWSESPALIPYAVHAADGAAPRPWAEAEALHLPEVLDDLEGAAAVTALARYRAMLGHLAAHRRWSRPLWADNLSPLQRLAVECFEDSRVDQLTLARFPGQRAVLLALHPAPAEDACDEHREAGLRHRLVCLSRALLDPGHGYRDPALLDAVAAFRRCMARGESNTREMADLALDWAARTRRGSDQQARMRFDDTWVDWRDDNRGLWTFVEDGDEEESFARPRPQAAADDAPLPPHHYPEWDEAAGRHRPDWVSVYDHLQPAGSAAAIERLLEEHGAIARRLERLLDRLKPQDRTRLRHQEQGSELDLDLALRSVCDWRAGAQPDPRVQMSTRSDARDFAVLLLLDLSASVNDPVPGSSDSVLGISRAAVALLAWAIDRLGDQFAIAGFHSNTRHELRYLHIKGFAEAWGEAPKARLDAVQGAYSTRMGAALRHAGHLLGGRRADKRLLLVLTDGEPADIDVDDPQHLIADAAQAVRELGAEGLACHCISLDAKADAYVGRIFGRRWSVIDNVAQLPRRLPELFLSLTR